MLSIATAGLGVPSSRAATFPHNAPTISPAEGGSSNHDGTCHVLQPGQTLYAVSRAYRVPVETLAQANGITDPSRIQAGRVLFVPGAAGPLAIPAAPMERLEWPLSGVVTSTFGSAGQRDHHKGIDIGGVKGQMVHAAAAGTVRWAGTERGYGNMVIIDHGDGLTTLYAHASRLLVGPDEWVNTGEPVAEVGDTGNARGAHLHFEVRRNDRPVNPLPLLGSRIAGFSGQN